MVSICFEIIMKKRYVRSLDCLLDHHKSFKTSVHWTALKPEEFLYILVKWYFFSVVSDQDFTTLAYNITEYYKNIIFYSLDG
jgi:hypothetical protein